LQRPTVAGKNFSVRGGIAICAGFMQNLSAPGQPGCAPAVLDGSGHALRAARPTTLGHRTPVKGCRSQEFVADIKPPIKTD